MAESQGSQVKGAVSRVVGVTFKKPLKVLYYLPHDPKYEYSKDEPVIIETPYGGDIAWVMYNQVPIEKVDIPLENLKRIIRPASSKDLKRFLDNWEKARGYIPLIRAKVREHNLPMHIIDAKYTPDEKRFVIFFSAESRVDFRKLVVDLAKIFRMRIELYQIGARDGAAIIGGIGVCGRVLCCHSFLREFKSISLSNIKEQELDLNPEKLTGLCGRLKCCLAYELETYRELVKEFPEVNSVVIYKVNSHVEYGIVISRNISGKYIYVSDEDNTSKQKVDLRDILKVISRDEFFARKDEILKEFLGLSEEVDEDLRGASEELEKDIEVESDENNEEIEPLEGDDEGEDYSSSDESIEGKAEPELGTDKGDTEGEEGRGHSLS